MLENAAPQAVGTGSLERRFMVLSRLAGLSGDPGDEDALPRLLECLGMELGWDFGILWEIGADGTALRRASTWHRPGRPCPALMTATEPVAVLQGVGLPGLVISTGRCARWSDGSPAAYLQAARLDGLADGFALPLHAHRHLAGILEFFSVQPQAPDHDLARIAAEVGQLGALILEHRRAASEANGHSFPSLDAMQRQIYWRRAAEHRLREAIADKNVLLREVDHRVKNNLQMVSSLLRLQAAAVEDQRARSLLRDSQSRVHCMALIHECLFRSESFDRIDPRVYFEELAQKLWKDYRAPETVSFLPRVLVRTLRLETAIPCGLIVTELLTNALKHAFPAPAIGQEIRLLLEPQAQDRYRLIVQNNGLPLPDLNWRRPKTLGMKVVSDLTAQLDGDWRAESGPPVRFTVTFPRP